MRIKAIDFYFRSTIWYIRRSQGAKFATKLLKFKRYVKVSATSRNSYCRLLSKSWQRHCSQRAWLPIREGYFDVEVSLPGAHTGHTKLSETCSKHLVLEINEKKYVRSVLDSVRLCFSSFLAVCHISVKPRLFIAAQLQPSLRDL